MVKEVKVTWKDIYFLREAEDFEALKEVHPAVQVTYGQLLVEEPDYITVVSTVDTEDEEGGFYRDAVSIPRGCIISVQEVNYGEGTQEN